MLSFIWCTSHYSICTHTYIISLFIVFKKNPVNAEHRQVHRYAQGTGALLWNCGLTDEQSVILLLKELLIQEQIPQCSLLVALTLLESLFLISQTG